MDSKELVFPDDLSLGRKELKTFIEKAKTIQKKYLAELRKKNPQSFGEEFPNEAEKSMPLSILPELTYEVFRSSINYGALDEDTQSIRERMARGCTEIELWNGFSDMLQNSIIDVDWNWTTFKRGPRTISYDGENDVFWKLPKGKTFNDVAMAYWVDWAMDD